MNKKLIGVIAAVIVIVIGITFILQGNRQQSTYENFNTGNDIVEELDTMDEDVMTITVDPVEEPENTVKDSEYTIMKAKQTINKSDLDENELEVLRILEAYFNIPQGMTVEEFARRALLISRIYPNEAAIPDYELYYNDHRIEEFPAFGEREIELVHFRFEKYFDEPEGKRWKDSVIIPVQVQYWQDGELHKIELNPAYSNRSESRYLFLTNLGFTKNDFYMLERLPENQVIFERE